MSEALNQSEIPLPEPRAGLWYCEIIGYKRDRQTFVSLNRDSLDQARTRRCTWEVASLPETMRDGLEVGKRFWWDRDAALNSSEENMVIGYFPVQLITEEEMEWARNQAAETIRLIHAQDNESL